MKISIKVKASLFILLLLVLNLFIIRLLMLKGIMKNQKQAYEAFLKNKSKAANLYIREKFLTSENVDFENFYIQNAEDIAFDLGEILDLYTVLYDEKGNLLGRSQITGQQEQKLNIMATARKNQIVYQKNGDKIVYLAPIYDFEKQIGIIQLEYTAKKERLLTEEISKLFLKVGLVSLFLTYILGHLYFLRITNNIIKLKKSVKEIEKGHYEKVKLLNKKDEFGDLSRGIYFMANQIKENITQIRMEKEKLQTAVEKLQKLEKQQKEFIGNITHEFKTPLTVIKVQIDLMTLCQDDEARIYQSKRIADKELKRLDSMVENALSLSRLEKYDFELKKEKFDTNKQLADICNRMCGKASKFGIEIRQNSEPAFIFMDKKSFMQIFINLIDNAIKYNVNGGRIFVRSYIKDQKNYIEIEDTGIGIPDEHKQKIFEPFYTVDKNRSKKFSGTGLGLSLVRKLVKREKGTIKLIDSKTGTLFEITFPLYT